MAYEGIAHAVGFTVNAVKETSLVAWNWTQAHRAQAAVNAVKETSLVAWDRAQAHPAQAAVDAVKETSLMAWDWAQAHPAQAAVTTVSVTLTPFFGFGWMFGLLARLLGFGKVGVGAGTIAAWWQTAYGGSVPAGSIFAALQAWGTSFGVG
ncbi:hypothetical protein MMC16_003729 [Acarospora aff. strigata]|nr:hypothetical protein [Acarospora aff. strigata]